LAQVKAVGPGCDGGVAALPPSTGSAAVVLCPMYKFYHGHSGQQRLGDARDQSEGEFDTFQGEILTVDLATINGQTEEFPGQEWLDQHFRDKLPFGFDLEWQPDRTKDSDNPIALMQFADESKALLLRTHVTRDWLPSSVVRVLKTDACLKVSVGWDGPDQHKFQNTFNFQPVGIYDLGDLAQKKGVQCSFGLKSLSQHFGLRMKKAHGRSNWAAPELLQEQIQYAADDAYFTYVLYEKLSNLPDPVVEEDAREAVDAGILMMRPGWAEQGIVRRHDGLVCVLCNSGAMNVPEVVGRHLEGNKHKRKMEDKRGLGTGPAQVVKELPDEYTMQGIAVGDGINNIKVGEFKCTVCNAGPFNNLASIDQHIKSAKHKKAMAPPTAPDPSTPAEPQRDPFQECLWNMPDYVEQEGFTMNCTLCISKASTPLQMYLHLGGQKHAKKCRSSNYPELIHIKERGRLEVLDTGAPVVRRGFKAPKRSGSAGNKLTSSNDKENVAGEVAASKVKETAESEEPAAQPQQPQQRPLAEGWQEHVDPASGAPYYFNPSTRVSQWERPEAQRQELPLEASAPTRLPPGWRAVMAQDQPDCVYYADVETQASQWDPPPAYVEYDWKRHVDPSGQPFWACEQLDVSFYESDSRWQRLEDHKQRVYWSNQARGIRFFEPEVL